MTGRRRVLVIGGGAREQALARALERSPSVDASSDGGHVRVEPFTTVAAALALAKGFDLVVVGPEAPLVEGIVDALEGAGVRAFGPTRRAAELEGSKAFLKRFAARHGIPTAPFVVVTSHVEAEAEIRRRGAPLVVKADGLCAGKGVVVARTVEEALAAAKSMLVDRAFGAAGDVVILEDAIPGVEVSVHAVSDGQRLLVLPPARDHKRVGDGDTGPNTGGMGAFAPVEEGLPAELLARIERDILRPTIDGMRAEGRPFVGALFAGLMITPAGDPVLLEHNVRFGDPECEVLMELLDGDVAELLDSAARGELDVSAVSVARARHALAVVLAAHGYPAAPRAGDRVEGLAEAGAIEGARVHTAGVRTRDDGALVTAGGRVVTVTARGASRAEARARAYAAVEKVRFDGMLFRRDIGG